MQTRKLGNHTFETEVIMDKTCSQKRTERHFKNSPTLDTHRQTKEHLVQNRTVEGQIMLWQYTWGTSRGWSRKDMIGGP